MAQYPWLNDKKSHEKYWGASNISEREQREIAWKKAHPGAIWDHAAQKYVSPHTGNAYKTQPHGR